MGDLSSAVESLGFPVTCVLGLAWYINKTHKETMHIQMKQMESSEKTIRETQESNKLLMMANKELLETNRTLVDGISVKVNIIENSILELKKIQRNNKRGWNSMGYTLKQNLVSSFKYSIKCPYVMTPEFIVVHNTSNDAPASNEVKYMISNDNQVSFHYAVDDKEVIQGIPTNRNAWHAGDGVNGKGNRKGIGVEICYSKSGGSKFDEAEKNAAQFVASLLKERGWGIDKVKKHQDFANKYCPHRTLDKGWNRFLDMVKSHLNGSSSSSSNSTSTSTSSNTSSNTPFTVKIICDELNIREKADFNSKVVGVVKRGEVFTIVEESNGLGKLKSGKGYISMGTSYVEKTVSAASNSGEYKVKIVNCSTLNVRKGAGTNYAVATTVRSGEVYTIAGETDGWLKLKSGVGYISKSYTERI